MSPHIVLEEAGLAYELVLVNIKTHQLADGSDYYKISPNGYVPLLELDDGTRLTEGPAIVQYLADQAPEKNLAPPNSTMSRYLLQSKLNFVSTELHKGFSPLFNPSTPAEYKPTLVSKLRSRLMAVDHELADSTYYMGECFTVVDAYLFTVTNWAGHVNLDISDLANLKAFRQRVLARPAVQLAMKQEGLLK